jgi:hypothetical protein
MQLLCVIACSGWSRCNTPDAPEQAASPVAAADHYKLNCVLIFAPDEDLRRFGVGRRYADSH